MNIGIIGGGAAGFFAAISAKDRYPSARVAIFEKSLTLLSKVRVSGGVPLVIQEDNCVFPV